MTVFGWGFAVGLFCWLALHAAALAGFEKGGMMAARSTSVRNRINSGPKVGVVFWVVSWLMLALAGVALWRLAGAWG